MSSEIFLSTKLHPPTVPPHSWKHASAHGREAHARDSVGCEHYISLERHVAVEVFKCIFLELWAAQAEHHLVPLYSRERRTRGTVSPALCGKHQNRLRWQTPLQVRGKFYIFDSGGTVPLSIQVRNKEVMSQLPLKGWSKTEWLSVGLLMFQAGCLCVWLCLHVQIHKPLFDCCQLSFFTCSDWAVCLQPVRSLFY